MDLETETKASPYPRSSLRTRAAYASGAATLEWKPGEMLAYFVLRLMMLVDKAGDLAGPPRFYVLKVSRRVILVDREVGEEVAECADLSALFVKLGWRAGVILSPLSALPENWRGRVYMSVPDDTTGRNIHLGEVDDLAMSRPSFYVTDYGAVVFDYHTYTTLKPWRPRPFDGFYCSHTLVAQGETKDWGFCLLMHELGLRGSGWQFPGLNMTVFNATEEEYQAWKRPRCPRRPPPVARDFCILREPPRNVSIAQSLPLTPWTPGDGPRPPRLENHVVPEVRYRHGPRGFPRDKRQITRVYVYACAKRQCIPCSESLARSRF